MLLPNAIELFLKPLQTNQFRYFVTGSIASIVYGEPRLTHDIDIVIFLNQEDIQKFILLFPIEDFYCPPSEVIHIESIRRPYGHFNLIHHATGFKADIYSDAGDPLHQWAFVHRKQMQFGNNLEIWIAPPEYVVIRKLEYFREGGSEKHLDDIQKMWSTIDDKLNKIFLKTEIDKRGLKVLWDRIKT
jgi:hypothetical protein